MLKDFPECLLHPTSGIGRRNRTGRTGYPHHFQLAEVETHEGYDAGGAFWGSHEGLLWCAYARTRRGELGMDEEALYWFRAADRAGAEEELREMYPNSSVVAVSGNGDSPEALRGLTFNELNPNGRYTKEDLAKHTYPDQTFDYALPQSWLDAVVAQGFDDAAGHFVWLYPASVPGPLTRRGVEILAALSLGALR